MDNTPSTLAILLRSLYPNPTLARRALFAPWPSLDFRSAWDERELWHPSHTLTALERQRKSEFERLLREEQNSFQNLHQPYFLQLEAEAPLKSPYGILSDAEYWLFVMFWGGDPQIAQHNLENMRVPSLGWKTTIAFLKKERWKTPFLRWLDRIHQRPHLSPLAQAWYAQWDLVNLPYA
jgi:hypothetical protein